MSSEKSDTLALLASQSRKAHELHSELSPKDSVQHLDAKKKAGWCRLLSSVSTTESIEQVLMEPLEKVFQENSELLDYISSHKQDELRHHLWLNRYIKNTFDYVKTRRTFSDQIIYDWALPKVTRTFHRNPIYGISMLYFFETYGVRFYRNFKEQAKKDGLSELVQTIELIEKDERRHLKGLETLRKDSLPCKVSFFDRIVISLFLKILIVDVNMDRWAFHNRKVRKHALQAGLDPRQLTEGAYLAAKQVMKNL